MLVRDRYWLAGLLEGEGCFYTTWSNNRVYRYPAVAVNMTDEDVISRAAVILGTHYRRTHPPSHRHKQPQYRIQITGTRAIPVMRELYPLLGERRRARIDEILQECDPRGTRYAA